MDNPLFLIAKDKQRERIKEGGFDFLNPTDQNINTFTLGFCDGVTYSTGVFQKQIAMLEYQLKELQKLQNSKP